ncbi:ComEA family DNA-binding protein [Xylella fastidiosa]|uniref:ComEA family DNA-binding protein n=1 Tax=Xylella fastidiosa subsp. multiplex TaxID=644357 RepID=A0A9Q4QT40_XYLFS|nr:ComEA family DNA-binding protein [Xylella fastidiosa]ERI61071.1 DNA transport competence protein [Xylella fastidiosa subsp. multiplex Griffin-1]ACA12615.1 DNA transport competence protein [Xylella fastidiosa M12]KAJ4853242.1 ComEA family DNA-binding protein [Xylella fastidiosa subsp. multiplex]KFA41419.1 DNA transport competence protein [Xylella fastidiosa]MBE0268256.1 ComEA family DNA-binding protein [Xylella fastidiosa subsp. multiplex]
MKSFAMRLKSLLLLFVLAFTVHAANKVDINTASAEEMDKVLVNIGPSKASAIVKYREENGPFKSVEELALVKGIGMKTVERNRDLIEIGTRMAPAKPAKGTELKSVGKR